MRKQTFSSLLPYIAAITTGAAISVYFSNAELNAITPEVKKPIQYTVARPTPLNQPLENKETESENFTTKYSNLLVSYGKDSFSGGAIKALHLDEREQLIGSSALRKASKRFAELQKEHITAATQSGTTTTIQVSAFPEESRKIATSLENELRATWDQTSFDALTQLDLDGFWRALGAGFRDMTYTIKPTERKAGHHSIQFSYLLEGREIKATRSSPDLLFKERYGHLSP